MVAASKSTLTLIQLKSECFYPTSDAGPMIYLFLTWVSFLKLYLIKILEKTNPNGYKHKFALGWV
ncbi:MAG: hypothetical protein DSY89_01945 [Deltaproteobacteria bacterium]|nr:MAG: hypothetical protein DSY89_01945 [Deltaproteobacteria bacterium]